MSEWFIDRSGQIPLYLHERRFITEDGHNVGWLIGNCVYSLRGAHVGWLENGVLYDVNNDIVALSTNASGHIRFISHKKFTPAIPPIPETPEIPPLADAGWRPLYGGRSNKTLEDLFGELP